MRSSIKKHYKQLDQFVRAANLGWDEILKRNDFPTMDKLDPHGKHRALLVRIERACATRFREIKPAGKAPLLLFPNWRATARAEWPQLHCYALVRRVFDSLDFLTRTISYPRPGTRPVPLMLEITIADDGSVVRVSDPYESFLNELSSADLRRLRACPACKRFFVAWRLDQKACRPRCANRVRVYRCREKKAEYAANRKFRKRTGLQAVRHGRNQTLQLYAALRSAVSGEDNSPVQRQPQEDSPDPSERSD